ncbi:SRPBCC family protein [Knoellia koreensis]|uniref:Polyketide cyclase n=1 Tax=Knoellia koreensis TaxID=2730921 RepID=A0A849HJ21_9MICO|nr:SRPBCC family protein [Knoellia sp. DB2414S]NNM46564.1 polyketide cyclase [Knoellia sp. DB2414S]
MIAVELRSPAPAETVWDLVADLPRWGERLPTMDSVTPLVADQPTGVGSRFEVRQPGLRPAVYTVTRWDPGAGFDWEARTLGVRTVATHEVTRDGDGSLLVLTLTWSGPMAWLARRVFGRKAEAMVREEAQTFARLATAEQA